MLSAEGIVPDGFYYHDCIDGKLDIDMAEFRFRHYIATIGAMEYDNIVEKLRLKRGRFYDGIHADARDIFGKKLERRGVYFD